MLNIAGRIFVDLKVDGNDLPHSPNLLEKITMTEGGGALSPAIELILNDYAGSLSKDYALTDGNELVVTVGKEPNDINTQTRQYRVFGIRTVPTGSGPRMQVIGIYDAPGYLTGSARESYKNTTAEVLRAVAAKCKLDFYGPEEFNGRKTSDNQVWLNIAQSRAMFVQQTTRHGYIDDHSAMYSALTSLGQLRYLNLNDVIETPKEKIRRQFVHNTFPVSDTNQLTTYIVRDVKTKSTAGLMNTWQNYGSTKMEQSLDGDHKQHDKVDVKTTANFLAINGTVKKTVERSRIEYSPVDCGNTHAGYERALYQNLKMMGLFSEHVSILTYDVTDLQLFDVVIYRQANSDPKEPVSNSDIYMVTGKCIQVKTGVYAERIELSRRSVTEKGATELATADSTAVSDSTIPNSTIDPTSNPAVNNLPKAQSLSASTKPAQSAFNTAKAQSSDLRKSYVNAANNVKGLLGAAKQVQGSVENAKVLVGQLKASIPSLRHYADMGKQMATNMKYSATNLKSLATNIRSQNLSVAVRRTLLMQPGGMLDSMTYLSSSVKNQMQMASVMSPLSYQMQRDMTTIESVSGGRAAVDAFNVERDRVMSNAYASRVAQADMWNSSVSVMEDRDIPNAANIAPANGTKMSRVMDDLYRAPVSGSSIAVPLSASTRDMTSIMTERNAGREPSWISPNSDWDYTSNISVQRESFNRANGVAYAQTNDSLWSSSNFVGETAVPFSKDTKLSYVYSMEAGNAAFTSSQSEAAAAEERESDNGDW